MKLKVLALGAAVASISCVTPCSAQLHIEPSASHPHSRVAWQDSQAGLDVFSQAPSSPTAASDTSDYFAAGAPGEGLGAPNSILTEQPSGFTSTQPGTTPSLPPSVAQGPAPVEAPLNVLAGTPEVGMVPVCWPDGVAGCKTPNPIADIMMRNWCTDGLWATYPAQRAHLCERIQHNTGGYNRYTHQCNTCAPVGPAHAWPATPAYGLAYGPPADPMAGVPQVPHKPVTQLVISPVMSAPAQLPTAQIASSELPTQGADTPATQVTPNEAPQPELNLFQATPNPLPADAIPAQVPVVAGRPAGFFR